MAVHSLVAVGLGLGQKEVLHCTYRDDASQRSRFHQSLALCSLMYLISCVLTPDDKRPDDKRWAANVGNPHLHATMVYHHGFLHPNVLDDNPISIALEVIFNERNSK